MTSGGESLGRLNSDPLPAAVESSSSLLFGREEMVCRLDEVPAESAVGPSGSLKSKLMELSSSADKGG